MRRILTTLALSMALAGSLSGCVVREERVATRPGCRGGVWIEGHHGRYGRWHPGHWRCPGVIERIEID